jgi:hypothetical protein
MRIAYLTTDEVNQELAVRLAEECGAELDLLTLRAPALDTWFDGVIYDWDYLPTWRQQEIMAELLSCPVACPTILHSYNLDAKQKENLRRNGVDVCRRLGAHLFRRLRRRSANYRPAVVPGSS